MSTELRSAEPDGESAGRPRLSKRTVTESALKLADADGLDALTIRKLAQHLGVTPMALYWHLRNAGFDPQHASAIARSALWTGITLVMSEPGYHPELPADERAETQRRSQIELAMLPAARYPRLVECAAPMTACDDPEFHYRFGIKLFVDGVKAAADLGSAGRGGRGPG